MFYLLNPIANLFKSSRKPSVRGRKKRLMLEQLEDRTLFNATVPAPLPFFDTFQGTQLSSYWVGEAGAYAVVNNQAVSVNGAAGVAVLDAVAAADVSVQADVNFSAANQNAGLVARYSGQGDANMYLGVLTYLGGGVIQPAIYKNVNGVWSQIGTSQYLNSTGGTLDFQVQGSFLGLFLNGSQIAFAQDSSLSSGSVGMRSLAGGALDNFQASTMTALSPINDVTVSRDAGSISVPFTASNPDYPLTTSSFTVSAMTLAQVAFNLNQQRGFMNPGNSFYYNARGQQEVYLTSTNGTWYFILPNGNLYQWTGSTLAGSMQIARLDATYYANPSLLYNAPAPSPAPTLTTNVVSLGGSNYSLSIGGFANFAGTLQVALTASDNLKPVTEFFDVVVNNSSVVTPSQPAPMPFNDAFHGTQLSSYWVSEGGSFSVANNQAISLNTGMANTAVLYGVAAADVNIQANVSFSAANQNAGLVARYSGQDDANMYLGVVTYLGGGVIQPAIYKNVNGVWSQIGTSQYVNSTGGMLDFQVQGSSLGLFLNGNQVAFAQDSSLSSGSVGMRALAGGALANFQASTMTVLSPINDVTVSQAAGSTSVPFTASNADYALTAGSFTVSALTLAQVAFNLDQQRGFINPGNSFYYNARGQQEEYLTSANGIWYFILPNGNLYQWTGTTLAGSMQIARLDASYYANPSLLYNAPAPLAGPTLTTNVVSTGANSYSLTLSGFADFTGTLQVSVTATDNLNPVTQFFGMIVTSGQPIPPGNPGDPSGTSPSLPAPANVSFANTVPILPTVTLQGAAIGTLTYSAQAYLNTPAARAFQALTSLGLTNPGNGFFFNSHGASEKYVLGAGNQLYYILPSGQLFKWTGNINAGTLVTTLDNTYWADPTLLLNAPAPAAWTSNSAQTFALTAPLGLYSSGNYYFNARGMDEKYLQGVGDQWYVILPSGQFYQFLADNMAGRLLGTLDVTYWSDPTQLVNAANIGATAFLNPITTNLNVGTLSFTNAIRGFIGTLLVQVTATDTSAQSATAFFTVTVTNANAAPALMQPQDLAYSVGANTPANGILSASDSDADTLTYRIDGTYLDTTAAKSYQLQQALGLYDPGNNFYFNARMGNEKYVQGAGNQWYYILPNGQLFQFNAAATPQSTFVATLDSTYWTDPNLLLHAPPPAAWTANAQAAYNVTHLPASLGLINPGNNYYFDARGFDEKYFLGSTAGQWYFILPSGQLYRWTGSIVGSALLGTLDVTYWSDPSLLLVAQASNNAIVPPVTFINLTSTTGASVIFNIQNITFNQIGQQFLVQVGVTDGFGNMDRKFFRVTITP